MSTMNALDTARVKLAASSTALEYTPRPGLKDVEEAKKQAKAAAEILDSAHRLMSYGIYTVADAPMDPGPALFDDHGTPVAIVKLPFPEELAAFDTWAEEEQLDTYEKRLDALRTACPTETDLDWTPWDVAWAASPKDTFARLLYAESRTPKSWAIPSDEERDAWLEQFEQPAPPVSDLTPEEHQTLFNQELLELENAGVREAGLKRKKWNAAEVLWRGAYVDDPAGTLELLQKALGAPTISWEIPVREVQG